MNSCITDHMKKDEEFIKRWKNTPKEGKERLSVTILEEAADFINKQAFEDFGMHNAGVGMEISKLILIAKKCLEEKKE